MRNTVPCPGIMAIAAFRYCLGRRTYIVRDCVDWLVLVWNDIDERDRSIIQRDLEEAFEEHEGRSLYGDALKGSRLGDECDVSQWMRVRALYRGDVP